MRERWRKIRRAPGYKVSSLGRVRSLPRVLSDGREHGGGELTPYLDGDGYADVTIKGERVHVAHLVLEAFVGPRPYGMEACHWPDSDRTCNVLSNLRWASHRENERDKTRQPERLDWNVAHRQSQVETHVTDCAAGG